MSHHPQPKETWPPRIAIWIDPATNSPAHEKYWDQHEDMGHIDHSYLPLIEHEALILEEREEAYAVGRAEAFEEAAEIFNSEAERIKNEPCNELVQKAVAFAGQRGAAMLCEKMAKAERGK